MVECSRQDLVCLHLAAHDDAHEQSPAPPAVSATGIGDALELGDTAPGRLALLEDLSALQDAGLVTAEERPVDGYDAPRTVYFLTEAGREHARRLRERVTDRTVVVTNGTSEEVPLAAIDRYFADEETPLVMALARLTDDGRVPLEHPVSEAFVARQEPLATVRTAIEGAFEREAQTVLVGGPVGVGKTTLVEAAIDRLEYEPAPVVARGTCRDGPTAAYGPIRQAFQSISDGGALLGRLDETREAVTPDDPDEVAAQRTALFADVADLLRDAATARPVVVFLDNLQWADPATLAVFEHLATTVTEWIYPVAFVGTYRTPAAVAPEHPFAAVRDRLAAAETTTEVPLDPLDRPATRRLLEETLGTRQVPAAFVDLVHDRTGGVPLYVHETAQHLLEQGAVDPATDEYPTRAAAVSLPAAVMEGIGERLAALDEASRELVELAAVVGERVPLAVLAAASDLPAAHRREYLDLLVAGRIFERPQECDADREPTAHTGEPLASDGSGTVRFVSGGVREAVAERLPAERAAEYHERVAEALVDVGDEDEQAARIGYHFEQAEDTGRAVEYYRRAGDHATETYANEVAVETYEQALALGRDAPAVENADLAAIAGDLAGVYRRTGAFDDAIETAEEGLALASDRSRQRCQLLGLVANVQASRGAYDEARNTAERHRELAAEIDARDLEAVAVKRLGDVATARGEYDRAREHLKRSLAIARDVDDERIEASNLNNLGLVAYYQREYDRAREYFERSLGIRRDLNDRKGVGVSLNNLGLVAFDQGAYDQAREYYEESLAIDRDLGDVSGEATSLNNLGLIAEVTAEYDRAREYLEQALEVRRNLGDRQGETDSLTNLGLVVHYQAEYDRAREYLERSLAIASDLGDRHGESTSLVNLGLVAEARGAYDQAREYFERSLAIARDLGDEHATSTSLVNLGRLARLEGDSGLATEYLERGLDLARDLGDRETEARSRDELGTIACLEHDHDRASEHLDAALETFEAMGYRRGIAEVHLRRAQLALGRGNPETARERARTAHDAFEEMGATRWEGRSRLVLGRIDAATGARDDAREHWQTSLETFETINAPPDALATLEELVEICRAEGDTEGARKWCQRSRDLLADAPEPTAAQHREWVRRHVAALEER